jgi:hypothetical protein
MLNSNNVLRPSESKGILNSSNEELRPKAMPSINLDEMIHHLVNHFEISEYQGVIDTIRRGLLDDLGNCKDKKIIELNRLKEECDYIRKDIEAIELFGKSLH